MGDVGRVFKPEELQGLSQEKRTKLQQELQRQIDASDEIKAILRLRDLKTKELRDKLDGTLNALRNP
jgi:hypothetical protein